MKKQKNFSRQTGGPGRTFNRRKSWMELYDSAWRAYRERFLAINKLCYVCSEQATVVDHLQAHRGDEVLFKKLDNHIPLCESCHNRATTLFDRNPKKTSLQDKISWMQWTRAAKSLSFKIKVLSSYEN